MSLIPTAGDHLQGSWSTHLDVPCPCDVELSGRSVVHQPHRSPGDSVEQLDALAELVLGPVEQADWLALPASTRRRRRWLFGRLAAKDAVRQLLPDARGRALHPREVKILKGRRGGPEATVEDPSVGGPHILVSIAHIDHVAVAIACADRRAQGIGIDVERFRTDRVIERFGLSESERRSLDGLAARARADHVARMWCAKEAVSKALGTGLFPLGGPSALTVERLDEWGARLRVHVAESPEYGARWFEAATARNGDVVLATAVARCRGDE